MDGFRKGGVVPEQSALVRHGTTLVINAFLQRAGARTALVTNEGFRDVLEIRRGNRPEPFRLDYRRDPVLVPRDLRFTVRERIGGDGSVVTPLDERELREIADRLAALRVEAVAVSFINSYLNPDHERQAANLLGRRLPDAYITAGTDLTQEWYEYERTSTAAANAFVGPRLRRYVQHHRQHLGDGPRLVLMGSNGGTMSVDRALAEPVMLVESGPVGGCIGTAALCHRPRHRQGYRLRHGWHHRQVRAGGGRPVRCPLALLCGRLRPGLPDPAAPWWTSSKSAPAAAPSRRSTTRGDCMWDLKAPDQTPAPPPTAWAARRPPLPTPIWCSAGSMARGSSAAT